MKRKRTLLIGNLLMGSGLLAMVGGVLVTTLSYLPKLRISSNTTYMALAVLFCGALIWLIGAKVSGHERIEDRYWSLCRSHKRKHHHL